ncbi:hypothetical protein [Legionella massiliensis]|uniref:hypothetical protein n=1 Tax=Legionella massiliensis TaxID=1034943 RepID=UPI0005C3528C|nr:hypothetical protein [Legionella massiliensis]
MKASIKLLHYLIILCLVFLSLKPLLSPANDKNNIESTHYSTRSSDCTSRAPLVSTCQLTSYYTLTEHEIQAAPYLFIVAGALFFSLIPLSSNSPVSRLFKPPI